MSVPITAERIRSMISDCRTEKEVLSVLRLHCVRFRQMPFSEGYMLNLRIPCKGGTVRIYRSCSRRAPFVVQLLTPVSMKYSGIPAFRPSIPEGAPFTSI